MNEQHLRLFGEFCQFERMTGGPDPHLHAVVHLSRYLPPEEQIWRVGLYVGFYNVPSAEAAWRAFPVQPSETKLLRWLQKHWDGLRFRRERKSVGLDLTRGTKMIEYVRGITQTRNHLHELKDASFDELWRFAIKLPHVGRYAATKLCECWYHLGLVNAVVSDIRAKGGWSPRMAVNMILGDWHETCDDTYTGVAEAESRAARIKELFPQLPWFEFEVMLCEYKASFSTKRQYPGRSLDSELAYENHVTTYFYPGKLTDHKQARADLSPPWALGEVQGWDPAERLKNLGRVVSEYGYTWSDKLYDYNATTDFAHPVRKGM